MKKEKIRKEVIGKKKEKSMKNEIEKFNIEEKM